MDKDKLGDSWYPQEFPDVKFTIDESVENSKKPMLLIWFHMECRDCHKMSWIVWRGRLFDFSTCICHEPVPVKEAESAMPIPVKPVVEDIVVIESLIIPGELVDPLKDFCFKHDTKKKDVIIKALHQFLEKT